MKIGRCLSSLLAVLASEGLAAPMSLAHDEPISNPTASAERCGSHIGAKPIHATLDLRTLGMYQSKTTMTAKSWWAYASKSSADPCDKMAYIRVQLPLNASTFTTFESLWDSDDSSFSGFAPPDACLHSTTEMALFGKRVQDGKWELASSYAHYTPNTPYYYSVYASTRIFGTGDDAGAKTVCSHSPEYAWKDLIDFGPRRIVVDPYVPTWSNIYSDYRLVASNWMHNHQLASTTDCNKSSCYYPVRIIGYTDSDAIP